MVNPYGNGTTTSKTPAAFHPLPLALFPPLFVYHHNIEQLEGAMLVRPLAIIVVGTSLLWAVLYLLQNSSARSALSTSLILILVFSMGHLTIPLDETARLVVVGFSCITICLVIAVDTRRHVIPLSVATTFLNVLATSLFLVTVAPLVVDMVDRPSPLLAETFLPIPPELTMPPRIVPGQPDVYIIILDSFGRQDVLRRLYDYDSGPFIEELRRRGFFVADGARSNYSRTGPSVASFLNLCYLDGLSDRLGRDSADMTVFNAIADGAVIFRLARTLGYRTIAFDPCGPNARVTSADVMLSHRGSLNELEYMLLSTTIISPILGRSGLPSAADLRRRATLYVLDSLPQLAAQSGPKLVFVHLLQPHFPYVFAADGSPLEPMGGDAAMHADMLCEGTRAAFKGYCDQMTFIADRILQVLDGMTSASSRPPIIIVTGDHGGLALRHWTQADDNYLDELHGVLMACSGPRDLLDRFYANISLVNVFRMLAGYLAGSTLPLLEDRCFFSPYHKPLSMHDVTANVGNQDMQLIFRAIADRLARQGDEAGARHFRAKAQP